MTTNQHPSWCVGDGRDQYSGRAAAHHSAPSEIRINTYDHLTVRLVQDSGLTDEPYMVITGVDCDEPVSLHLPFAAAEELKEALVGLLGAGAHLVYVTDTKFDTKEVGQDGSH